MKSRRLAAFRWGWALTAALGLFAAYAHWGFLPTERLRAQAFEKIRVLTGKHVAFSKAVFLPGLGLAFDDFRLTDETGSSLFSARVIRLDIKTLPFFTQKKIVVRNLLLDTPRLDWSAHPSGGGPSPLRTEISGQIEVPVAPSSHLSLASLESGGVDALLPENVYLEQIEIRRGRLRFYAQDRSLSETVEIADLKMAYRKPPVVDIHGEIRIGSPVYSTLRLTGGWDLAKARYDFFLQFRSDRVPAWLEGYQKKHILVLREGRIELAAKLSSITEKRASFHAKAKLSQAMIQAAHASIRGQTSFDAKGVFDFGRRGFERYKGTLFLDRADLENLSKQFPRIDRVTGRIGFEPDLVTIEAIEGHWQKLDFIARGTIRSFKELLLNGEIRSRMDIQDALALIPAEQKKLLAGFRVGGSCDALTTLTGSLRAGQSIAQEHRLVVENGFLENPEKKLRLDDLAAEFVMDQKGLQIRNARFSSLKTRYRLEASIPQKPASRGSLQLSTDAWTVQADYDARDNDLVVRSGKASGYGATLSFSGDVRNVQNPYLNLHGKIQADLSKLEQALPAPASNALKGAGLRGLLSGPLVLTGPWSRPKEWDLRLDAKSPRITVKEWCKLDEFEIQLRAQNGVIEAPYIHAKPYGGAIAASYTVDINRSPAAFSMKASGGNLNLEKIAKDLLHSANETKGKLIFSLEMRGPLPDNARWTGKGSVGITDGNFGRTNRFKDMGKLPFVRVEGMDDVTFHQLRATFDVHDKKVWTRDLSIYGDNVYLFLDGAIGFDQQLDLSMQIRYSQNILDGAFDTGGIVPFVVGEANAMISDYRVKGLLSKPVFEKSILPVNPVGSVTKKVNTLTRTLTG